MKLKKLILHGFKSFADRTEFAFDDGITVVVGPNGCGKSNIVDAVKWVLGEQRPSSLRGKEMQDVIFSGTESRKGVGFAEVSLILDNSEGVLDIEYEEVAVTRRLYRSGESEYSLNGNLVRLRDIRELMMDSGGGPGALSVMEQGNIDRLLRADPTERRQVFEEAAGIAKYRARRKETQRKLERTGENLDRLRDLLGEYETRERSLKIQAGKARRFEEFTDELKKKRVASALARYADLARRRDQAQVELERVVEAEQQARGKLQTAVAESQQRRDEQADAREKVAQGEAGLARLTGEQRASGEKRAAREREAEELESRAQVAQAEGAEAARRAGERGKELEQACAERDKANRLCAEREDTLQAAEALLLEVESRTDLLSAEREALDLERTEAFAAETEARNAEMTGQAEQRALRTRFERLEERARNAQKALAGLRTAGERTHLVVRSAEESLRAAEERSNAAEDEVKRARDESERAAQAAAEKAGETAALGARREVLGRLVAEGEGLGDGTRALLEASRDGLLDGIRGVLADLLGDVGDQASVLDTALGDLAGAVVVETTAQAVAAVEWVKEGERGRARLIVLDRLRNDAPALDPVLAALDLGKEAQALLGSLLYRTRFAASFAEALDRARDEAGRVIARSGEEVSDNGSLAGGTGERGAGLVVRNTELAQIDRNLNDATVAAQEASGRAAAARSRATEWERTISTLRPQLKELAGKVRIAGEKYAAAKKAVAARSEEMELESAERAEVARLLDEQKAELEQAQARRAAAENARAELEGVADDLQERTARTADQRDGAAARREEARVEAARWTEKAQAASQHCRALEESIATATREATARTQEADRCRARRLECLDEIAALNRLAEEGERALRKLAREVEEKRSATAAMQSRLDDTDRQLDQLHRLHEERRELLEAQRMKENEYRLRIDALLDQVRADQGLELTEEEIAQESAEQDPEVLEAEISELRRKIEKLGNVNHAALEELGEVGEKLGFYRREEQDLVAADKQLRETINRIDEICRTRFTETFDAIRENFRVVFRKLFGGGKAEIFLDDPEDVLASGIEIAVRPPGKELRNMALLSGGEKSLTTVALLFSIYQAKPPPFCLLDEVDAALDESNTVRLCEMLKDFATRGQFLVITHARPTMTVADRLYGITMPEAGVSRRVSVRFADIEAGRVVGLN